MPLIMSFLQNSSAQIARAMLRDRRARRRIGLQLLGVLLLAIVVGAYVLDNVLESSPFAFAIYWLVIVFFTALLAMLALYDALRVVTEEKEKVARELAELEGQKSVSDQFSE